MSEKVIVNKEEVTNNVEVGKRIRQIRLNLGLTQKEFGELIDGANSSLVSKWENGLCLPNRKRIVEIAKIGEVRPSTLLGHEGDSESKEKEAKRRKKELPNQGINRGEVGSRIYQVRKSLELNQESFAELIGVPALMVERWETNRRIPNLDHAERIGKLGLMSVESIYLGKDFHIYPKRSQRTLVSQIEDEYNTFYRHLESGDTKTLLKEAERLTIYGYALAGIKDRLKDSRVDEFVYLGKNSLLDKFFKFFKENQFRGVTTCTVKQFEQSLTVK